jgi:acyl-CoA thioesterase FadM
MWASSVRAVSDLPPVELVLGLPAQFDQTVGDEFIDDNGHMNITDYFRLGSWAPWRLLQDHGVDDRYIPDRGLSFFTVEHHLRYASELRAGERFSVHAALLERTGKAVRAAGVVVDREHERVACALEVVYVHVEMQGRRSAVIPDDVAAGLDEEIARGAALAPYADQLALRR